MVLTNFHTHTTYCDGLNTAEEMAEAAVALGFRGLGFSGHGYVPFDGLWHGMLPDDLPKYRADILELKERYAGRLDIYLGIENDSVNMLPVGGYDYSLGSVHCICRGGMYHPVDSTEENVARAVDKAFDGDGLAYALAYFDAVREFAAVKRADILAHIDLVRRFNGEARFFDASCAAYKDAAAAALEEAVRAGWIIEVSTAPLTKGFSGEPYPAQFLLEHALALGARVMVNSDSHATGTLNYAFDRAEALLVGLGFRERWELTREGFAPVPLTVAERHG